MRDKVMDHSEYPRALRAKSAAELFYIADDARAALVAIPDGGNAGYYADEINYVSNELARRRDARHYHEEIAQ